MNRFINLIVLASALIPATASGQVCARRINVPDYPAMAWSAQWTGVVNLEITVGAQGQVVAAEANGSFPLLVRQAKENLKGWLFCVPKNKRKERLRFQYVYRLKGAQVYPKPTAKVAIDLGTATAVIESAPPQPQP